jgi:hypothetical protein
LQRVVSVKVPTSFASRGTVAEDILAIRGNYVLHALREFLQGGRDVRNIALKWIWKSVFARGTRG